MFSSYGNSSIQSGYSLEQYREKYKEGVKLRLLSDLKDPYTPKMAGDICTVKYVDDAGNIHVSWKSGGSLSLIIGVDDFEIIQ